MKLFDYIYEGGKNYIQTEEAKNEDYITKMLVHNNIAGFVGARLRSRNAEDMIVYPITGLVPLTQLVEIRRLSSEGVEALIRSFIRIMQSMEEYLLPIDRLIIEPEHIYQNYGKKNEFLWIYGGEETRGRSIVELFQFLLDKMDSKDDRAVNLIYTLYQTCKNFEVMKLDMEAASMLTMVYEKSMELLSSKKAGIEFQVNRMMEEENHYYGQEEKERDFSFKEIQEEEIEESISYKAVKHRDVFVSDRKTLKERIGRKKEKEPGRKSYPAKTIKGKTKMKDALLKAWKYLNADIGSEKEESMVVEEPLEKYKLKDVKVIKPSENVERATTLLTNGLVNHGMYCLKSQERNEDPILITSYPFFIGKAESEVHLRLEDSTVSRYHARIDREENEFFITDLGSTNGTFLNGTRILPFERLSIKERDFIVISRKKYEFGFMS